MKGLPQPKSRYAPAAQVHNAPVMTDNDEEFDNNIEDPNDFTDDFDSKVQ